ncbi:hypothetical protein CC86DRAFT_375635 [Ophiobolus disseminans]|uniref:Uncharacterized protein n=1 Tax=Ophiobolus disseminans TaxID=1469910 RepID=A0A6A6ZDJ6_9PLEO|nr:hypothetical protein CC86DRAFT_375635 [Ophiobolus disseminans]
MPPRIPVRFPWPSRSTVPCVNGRNAVRNFTSTPPTLALGPQSPNYIDVPKPLQPTFPLSPQPKGHLPVPRDVFKTRNRHPKQSPVFLARSTRVPKDAKAPGPYSRDAEYRLYKQRLADTRRSALRDGVKQLHDRKLTNEALHLSKIKASYADMRARASAPPRETDVLTATSLSPGIRAFLAGTLPNTSRENIPKRRDAYHRRHNRVYDQRRAQLHDLYVNARTFIVDEAQLDDAIEKTFGTEEDPMGWNQSGVMGRRSEGGMEGLSPWHGAMPEGVGDMLTKLRGGEGVGLAKERAKKVAEELTGGKM